MEETVQATTAVMAQTSEFSTAVAQQIDKLGAVARAHPVAATAVGVLTIGLAAYGGYKIASTLFGTKK